MSDDSHDERSEEAQSRSLTVIPASDRAQEPADDENPSDLRRPTADDFANIVSFGIDLDDFYASEFGIPKFEDEKKSLIEEFPPVDGDYHFYSEQKYLAQLQQISNLSAPVAKTHHRLVKLTVTQSKNLFGQFEVCTSKLVARTYDGGTFSEIAVRLDGPAQGLAEGQSITLVVSLDALAATILAIDSVARFTVQVSA